MTRLIIATVCAACALDAQAVRFAILGDRTGGAEPGVYEEAVREIGLLRPDFVVNAGDTIERRSTVPPVVQWTEIRNIWSAAPGVRFFLTPGNHDIYSPESEAAFRRETGREPYYNFTRGAVHVVVLDNSRTWEIEPQQLRFLESDLEKHASIPVKLVFFHKPYWLESVERDNRDFELHRMAKEYGVTAIISGHGHRFLYRTLDGIAYLEAGSAGGGIGDELRSEGFPGGWFYGFYWAVVEERRLHLAVKELSPPFGQGRLFPATDLQRVPKSQKAH